MRRSKTATQISSGATAELCIRGSHVHTRRPTEKQTAVDGMLQEVEESTAILLPAAEQVLQELEEEARANWEERAVYHATQVTNLAGQALRP
jgi:hypothetical protein